MAKLEAKMRPPRTRRVPARERPMLFLFGGGHVCHAVAGVAGAMGFRLTVADARPGYVSAARFPGARRVSGDWDEILAGLTPDRNAYMVICTPGHREDMRILEWAAGQPTRYIGMIGSRRKIISTYRELLRRGVAAESLKRVQAPMGLDIGAVTPEEIAIAVVAEMVAVRRGAEVPHKKMDWPAVAERARNAGEAAEPPSGASGDRRD